MGKVIRIDDDIFKELQRRARPLVDTPNDVLRTVFGLDTAVDGADTPVQVDTTAEKESHETMEQVSMDVGHQIGTTTDTLNRGVGIGKLTIETSRGTVVVNADFEDALYERFSNYLDERWRGKRKGRKEARYKAMNTLIWAIFDTYLKNNNY